MADAIDPRDLQRLDEQGFVLLEGFNLHRLDRVRARIDALFEAEGEAAGGEFRVEPGARRLAGLAGKGAIFREVMCDPRLLALVRAVLGPDVKVSSVNARRTDAGRGEVQPLHADHGAVPDRRGAWVCNVVHLVDDFTPDNGAIRAVPGSHRSGQLPREALDDPRAPHPDEVLLTGPAGAALVMNAHLWHGAVPNRSGASRTALHTFYCRRDKPQQQYQKPLLDAATLAALLPEERHLLAVDDSLNDALSADSPRPASGFLR